MIVIIGTSLLVKGYGPFPSIWATSISDVYSDDGDFCLDVVNRNGIFSVWFNKKNKTWNVFDGHYSLLDIWIHDGIDYNSWKVIEAFNQRKRLYTLPGKKINGTKKNYIRD